jgi:hypothetical protein
MTWVNLEHTWGLPAVACCLSRHWLLRMPPPIFDVLDRFDGSTRSQAELATFVDTCFGGAYPGVTVLALDYNGLEDALVIVVVHPDFPQTPPGQRLPRWTLRVSQADTDATRYTFCPEEAP